MNQKAAVKLAEKMPEWIKTDKQLMQVAKDINLEFYVRLAKDSVYLFVWFIQVLYSCGYKIVKGEKDALFIKHIAGHLKPGEEVVCKICGKSAKQIIEEE